MANIDYKAEATLINDELRQKGLSKVRKSDIRAKFNVSHDAAPAIWAAMLQFGWSETWSYLERLD